MYLVRNYEASFFMVLCARTLFEFPFELFAYLCTLLFHLFWKIIYHILTTKRSNDARVFVQEPRILMLWHRVLVILEAAGDSQQMSMFPQARTVPISSYSLKDAKCCKAAVTGEKRIEELLPSTWPSHKDPRRRLHETRKFLAYS